MLRSILIFVFSGMTLAGIAQPFKYYGGNDLTTGGMVAGERQGLYDRLPEAYREKVRKEVWDLSRSSAGITIHFFSNSSTIRVKWELLNNFRMNHMPETGIKGVDLYTRTENGWQYVNTAKPTAKTNESELVKNMSREMREYKLFLPLYDGVTNLEVGVDELSEWRKADKPIDKPIIFYGTSITQGGCASRPGMAHTNIISRKLDRECINLGFSGNGRMEKPLGELMAETDALFYVIDCLPNMKKEQITLHTIPLVELIRKKRPETPIVLIESTMSEKSVLDKEVETEITEKNIALKAEYDKLVKMGYKNIHLISVTGALGADHEGTVDGVHLTDLGFMRFAEYLVTKFEELGLVAEKK